MKSFSLYFLSMAGLNLIGSALLLSGCAGPKKPAEAITIAIDSTFTESVDGTAVVVPDSLPTINTLSEAERKEGWQLLFDGKSTGSWRGYGKPIFPDSGWAVQEGLLMVKGDDPKRKGRDIVTRKEFGDFELRLEFKLAPEASSGIFYRVKEKKGVPAWQNAPEYQLIDQEAWEKKGGSQAMHTHRTGDNFDLMAASVQAMKPVGEWNEARVRIQHNQVEHWLNGQRVVAYELGSPEWKKRVSESKFASYPGYGTAFKGPVALQENGSRVWFRNIKIREI